jgi:hypothetical protein
MGCIPLGGIWLRAVCSSGVSLIGRWISVIPVLLLNVCRWPQSTWTPFSIEEACIYPAKANSILVVTCSPERCRYWPQADKLFWFIVFLTPQFSFLFFFFSFFPPLVSCGEAGLGPLSTWATIWPILSARMMSVEQSVEWELAWETNVFGGNLCQCHFVHHKSHIICTGIEPVPTRWKASGKLPEL